MATRITPGNETLETNVAAGLTREAGNCLVLCFYTPRPRYLYHRDSGSPYSTGTDFPVEFTPGMQPVGTPCIRILAAMGEVVLVRRKWRIWPVRASLSYYSFTKIGHIHCSWHYFLKVRSSNKFVKMKNTISSSEVSFNMSSGWNSNLRSNLNSNVYLDLSRQLSLKCELKFGSILKFGPQTV